MHVRRIKFKSLCIRPRSNLKATLTSEATTQKGTWMRGRGRNGSRGLEARRETDARLKLHQDLVLQLRQRVRDGRGVSRRRRERQGRVAAPRPLRISYKEPLPPLAGAGLGEHQAHHSVVGRPVSAEGGWERGRLVQKAEKLVPRFLLPAPLPPFFCYHNHHLKVSTPSSESTP